MLKRLGLHTGHALGADLFLVGEDAHGGLLRHVQLQNRGQFRIRADAVVMAVGADEAAVKAEVAGVRCRDGLQLGGDKILLHNAIFLMQDAHDGKLHAVGAVVVRLGPAADKDVEGFGRNGLVQRLFALFAAQMGQQVVDDELRVFGVRADLDIDFASVRADDLAVQLQRDRDPLVLADAAVVVRLDVGQLRILIEGVGLEVQTRRVGMGRADVRAFGKRLFSDHGQQDGLAAVDGVDLVARLEGHTGGQLTEARLFGQLHGGHDAFALGLRAVEERLIVLAVGQHRGLVLFGKAVAAMLGLIKQRLSFLFCHGESSFQNVG